MNEPLNNPEKYKWGIFYFDPSDSRVFVPKNIQWLGYTVNFANPTTYLILGAFIAIAIFVGTINK